MGIESLPGRVVGDRGGRPAPGPAHLHALPRALPADRRGARVPAARSAAGRRPTASCAAPAATSAPRPATWTGSASTSCCRSPTRSGSWCVDRAPHDEMRKVGPAGGHAHAAGGGRCGWSTRASPPWPRSCARSTWSGADDAKVRLRRDRARRARGPAAAARPRPAARLPSSRCTSASCATSGSPRSKSLAAARDHRAAGQARRDHAPVPAARAPSSGPACRSSRRCTRIGAEADNSLAAPDDGRRRGRACAAATRLSDCLDRHPKIFPEFYRGILRSAELTGQLDTVLDQLADLPRARPRGAAQDQVGDDLPGDDRGDVAGHRRRAGRLRAAAVQDVLRRACTPKLPLPTRMLLAVTDFLTHLVVGARSAARLAIVLGIVLSRCAPTGGRLRPRPDRCCRLPVVGETIQYALVERFCRILASMVGAGVAAAARRCGSPPTRCATWSSSARPGDGQRGDAARARAWPARWPRPGSSRPPPPR